MPFAGLLVSKKLATALSTPFLVGQPSQLNIAAQLSVIWAPLLGAGQLPGAAELPAYLHPCFVRPPETATPHNSFSNPIDGFFAPGGTEVWQADKTFEWLLATAFGRP